MKKRNLTDEALGDKIHLIRGKKVMLDKDLAELYAVSTGNFNKAVQRNAKRFPKDFMFRLTRTEFDNLIFQFGRSSWGGSRKCPYAFIEQGVSMLASVLRSDRAIAVNIHIIRVFTKMRELLITHKDMLLKLDQLERTVIRHDDEIRLVFKKLKQLLTPVERPTQKIGFIQKSA